MVPISGLNDRPKRRNGGAHLEMVVEEERRRQVGDDEREVAHRLGHDFALVHGLRFQVGGDAGYQLRQLVSC